MALSAPGARPLLTPPCTFGKAPQVGCSSLELGLGLAALSMRYHVKPLPPERAQPQSKLLAYKSLMRRLKLESMDGPVHSPLVTLHQTQVLTQSHKELAHPMSMLCKAVRTEINQPPFSLQNTILEAVYLYERIATLYPLRFLGGAYRRLAAPEASVSWRLQGSLWQ